MLLHPRRQLADCVIAAAEEGCIFFPEWLKAPVWADRPADGGWDRLAAQRGAEIGEAFALLQDAWPLAEIDPGQKLQEPGWRRIATGHEHRNHREFLVAGLPNERKLALILLGIAEPMRADQDGDGLGAADRVFKRPDPAQAPRKLFAVEESF
jgi:hypothetical protein